MAFNKLALLPLVLVAVAADPLYPNTSSLESAIRSLFPDGAQLTHEILKTFLEPNEIDFARNSYVYRDGSRLELNGDVWTASGANVYWLGLDENVIPPASAPFYTPFSASYPTHGRIVEIMNTLVTMGARTIRSQTLGVSTGNPLSVMPSLGVYNEEAFDTIDWTVFQARQHGLRIVAPLTDNYDYYHGGKYNFLRWRGFNITQSDNSPLVMQFYTNRTIINDFKNYIRHLLTHRNPYTGLSYADDPTIFAYETGNELGGPKFGDKNVPAAWTQEIAQYIKQLGPHKLVIDGTYGINVTHLSIPEVDIYSDHFYPLNVTKLEQGISQVGAARKVYLAAEYDWTGLNGGTTLQGDSPADFYSAIEAHQASKDPVVAGDLFWSLFMHNVPDCAAFVNHTDGFAMQYGNPLNSPAKDASISLVRQHFFAMQKITVDGYLPAVPCPHNFIPGYDMQYTYL